MLLMILAFIASLIPSVLVFILLRRRHGNGKLQTESKTADGNAENKPEEASLSYNNEAQHMPDAEPTPPLPVELPSDTLTYRKYCSSALLRGMLCALPVLALSGILFILNGVLRATLLGNAPVLLYKAIYTFIVLALAEEIVKFFAFKLFLKKKPFAYKPADMVAIMVIIGTGFGMLEAGIYAVDSSPILMFVRGITIGHVGYGFLTGLFYAKRMQTDKKLYGFLAVLIPWLIHGLYDFSLSPELIAVNDNFSFLGVSLALFDIVLLILMIRYFVKAKKAEKAAEKLPETKG